MKIIVPCGGKSSRFPNMRPKWMLNAPNGNLMVVEALRGIEIKENIDIIITILKEHEEKYNIIEGLKKNFREILNKEVIICILDKQTKSQSETVYETIKKMLIKDAILIKDSDNYFELKNINEKFNYVSVDNLKNHKEINPGNKSYIKKDENGLISEIIEKEITSDTFSIGGYYFKDSEEFVQTYKKLEKDVEKEIYISDIISSMILQGKIFFIKNSKNYKDWGTSLEWLKFKNKVKTYFIDIDGVLFENGAQYFNPKWGTTTPLLKNIDTVKNLKKLGNYIVITTSRTEEFREQTIMQFKEVGLEYDQLVMGIGNGERVLINDYSTSNPFPSCTSINIKRNSDTLNEFLEKF